MYKLAFLFSMFFALNINALTTNSHLDSPCGTENLEECLLAKSLFLDNINANTVLDIASLDVIEIEEEVALDFDTSKYLPEGFNALEGKGDLNWNTIEIYEIEEEVALNFDTANYLPEGFNALEGKGDLNWNSIEIYEIEEEVALNFDTTKYLPKGFNALKGKDDLDWSKIEIVEIDEEIDLYDNNKYYCSL